MIAISSGKSSTIIIIIIISVAAKRFGGTCDSNHPNMSWLLHVAITPVCLGFYMWQSPEYVLAFTCGNHSSMSWLLHVAITRICLGFYMWQSLQYVLVLHVAITPICLGFYMWQSPQYVLAFTCGNHSNIVLAFLSNNDLRVGCSQLKERIAEQ